MAVWMQVFGEKKFENTSVGFKTCKNVLPQVELDLAFLGEQGDPHLSVGKQQNFFYNKNQWQISLEKDDKGQEYIQAIYWLSDEKQLQSYQIRLYFFPDMVEFLGRFEHFQAWNVLGAYPHLEEGYRKIVKSLFQALEIKEAIYCSEGFFSNDEFQHSYRDIKEMMEAHRESQATKLEGIQSYEYFVDRF